MAAVAALILHAPWLTVGSGSRVLVQLRRTGDSSIRSAIAHGSAQRWAKLLFVGAFAAGAAAPIAEPAGLGALALLDNPAVGPRTLRNPAAVESSLGTCRVGRFADRL